LRNFSEILIERSVSQPGTTAYRFFAGANPMPEALTYRALWEKAASLAQVLQAGGMRDQRVLLVCKSQKNFVVAFYACLLAGAIVVPTALPRRQVLQSRLQLLMDDAGVGAVICDADEMLQAGFGRPEHSGLCIDMRVFMQRDDHAQGAARFVPPAAIDDDAVALLQYTSGSTGKPKGVMISHRNLMRNCAVIQDAMEVTSSTSALFALPLFHDMGLIGGMLQPMYSGCTVNLMPPAEFVQYPERWLRIMSTYRLTVSGGPNFMYELAARAVDDRQCEGLDLSAWRVACCGAEPIRPETVARFRERFGPFGFRPDAFYPCYGLAESTLFVTGPRVGDATVVAERPGQERPGVERTIGCGKVWRDTRVEIVDQASLRPLPEGEVGEIWVAGGSVAKGYWMQPERTAETFEARLAGDDATRFLRTGDLGFVEDGNLFVTGRLKDLIILYGKKYTPHDLEFEAERSHQALRQSGCAAFGAADVSAGGAERLVLVCEVNREWLRRPDAWDEVTNAIRASVGGAFGVQVDDVVLIKPGALPRTSSGKLRRQQCRSDYLEGRIERLGAAQELAECEQ